MKRLRLRSEQKFDAAIDNFDCRGACFLGGGSAPPPDPALGQSALSMAETAREQLAFNQRVYEEGKPRQAAMDALSDRLVEQQMGIADDGRARATELWDRWKSDFAPLEADFAALAKDAGGAADQAAAAGRASADIEAQTAAQRDATNRSMASMGVNPASGKFQATNRAADIATAGMRAGAMTTARQNAVDRGLAIKGNAINVGRGLPAIGMGSDSLALSGGQSATASQMASNGLLAQRVGSMNQGYNAFQSGIGNAADAYGAQYQSAVNAHNARQQRNGAIVGAGITAAAMMASDARLKTDLRPVGAVLDGALPVYEFEYRTDLLPDLPAGKQIGVLAQDVVEIDPDAVAEGPHGYLMVDYARLPSLATFKGMH